jgi:hypothetical protein
MRRRITCGQSRKLSLAVVGALLVGFLPTAASAAELKTLFSFCVQGTCSDVRPLSDLVLDEAGSLYGVTLAGGDSKGGSVFRLTPDKTGSQWTETTLYSFCSQNGCADGGYPYSGLIRDQDGNLYGTTQEGGAANYMEGGVVFQLTPGKTANTWTETVLHSFCSQSHCADGSRPHEGLVMDRQGNIYGTTQYGGDRNLDPLGEGVVFKLTPDRSKRTWTETVIYRFCSQTDCADGHRPFGGLSIDQRGNLYGTTLLGGGKNSVDSDGSGIVFKLTPDQTNTVWTETVLYRFCQSRGCADGRRPIAKLVFDYTGNLFGMTQYGGSIGNGTVFELIPGRPASRPWTLKVLYRFCSQRGCADGKNPRAPSGLVLDSKGNLYGTTVTGGNPGGDRKTGYGVVFELTPAPRGDSWIETVLYKFCTKQDCTDGYYPYASLVADCGHRQHGAPDICKADRFFGTTVDGGAGDSGSIFELTLH